MKRKILSVFLVLCMIFSLLPVSALAEESTLTRAEWIQSLVETFDMTVDEETPPENYYRDLTGEESYYRDILVAAEFGVIDTPAGEAFEPSKPATREFAAHTLNFCLGFQLGEGKQYTYAEFEEVNYPDDVQVAVNRGWFALVNGKFMPQQSITSAEAQAMLKDAANVLAGNTVSENYNSTYTFEKDVVVIPDGTTVSVNDNTVTVTDCPKTIEAGQMFAVYVNGIPQAFVANSVSVSGNVTTIQATPTDEAFASIDAQGVVEADPSQVEALDGTELSYYVEETEQEYKTYEMAKAAQRRIGGTFKPKNISLSFKTDVKITSAITVSVSGKLKNPTVSYNINLLQGTAYVSLAYDMDVSYTVKGEVSGAKSVNDIKLFYWGIPGVGGFSITYDMELSGSIKGTQSGHEERGLSVSIANGTQLTKSFKAKAFSIEIEASAQVGFQAKFGVTELPVFNVYIYGKVGEKANLKSATYKDGTKPERCTHFAAYLYAECGVTGSVKILSYKKSLDIKYVIFNENNSPIRICHHYEDGKLVPECTRGDVSSWFGSGFGGYYTPGDSAYMSSGWYGGNGSTGYDSNGKPIVIYEYTLDKDNNATITSYKGNATALSVPETIDGYTVVAIGDGAFRNKQLLRFVTLPDSITKIGANAFENCTSLVNVSLPDSLTEIGSSAFYNCSSLEEIRLPDSLNTLSHWAFGNCTSLRKAYIPKSIEKCSAYWGLYGDGGGPFLNCSSLNQIEFAEGITNIPSNLFTGCTGLKEIDIPNTVTTINDGAFQDCTSLSEVKLPDTLTKIGNSAFKSCISLVNVSLPDNLTEIGNSAFYNCSSLEEIRLPDSLNTLSHWAFGNCTSLRKAYIPKSIEKCSAYWGLYGDGGGPFFNCSSLNQIEFAEGITNIPSNLFTGCTGLKEIDIPNTVTTVNDGAFQDCTFLSEIKLPDTLTKIGSSAFKSCISLVNVSLPDNLTEIGNSAFYNCSSLEEIRLPDSLKSLSHWAFGNCTSLGKAYIPKSIEKCSAYWGLYGDGGGPFLNCSSLNQIEFAEGITNIPSNLFTGCTGLKEIVIPNTVTTINNSAFQSCISLSGIKLPDTLTKIGNSAFSGCTSLVNVSLPDNLAEIGNSAFSSCSSLKQAKLSNAMNTVPDSTFYGCTSLESIAIPDSIKSIKSKAFMNCTALKSVSFGNALNSISDNAFNNCDALTEIDIPSSVDSIGSSAFYDCDALVKATIPDSVTNLGSSIFYDCDLLSSVKLGSGITKIPDNAFNHCDALQSIVIPRRVTAIGNNAFKDCVKLTEITLPRSVESIPANAFSYPAKLTIYGVAGTYAETYANENSIKFVDKQIKATSATLDKTTLTLNKGSSAKLSLNVTPADFTDEVNWKSADTSIATIAADGTVKAVGVGSTTIKVTVGNASASCKVTVVQPVTSISLNKTSLSLEAFKTYQLTATPYPANAQDKTVKWESSNPAVATVSDTGLVTAVGKGTATITASVASVSGVSRTCTVSVTNNGILATTVEQLESPHNYENNCSDIWIYSIAGASAIRVTFDERTNVEDGFDYLYIYDANDKEIGKYTGTELAGKAIDIDGNIIKIKLVTDNGGNEWGFKVTSVENISGGHTHHYTDTVTAPTCTEKGYTTHTCACGDSYVDSYTNALGHSFGAWKQTKAPTCTAGGTESRSCTRCNATETRTVAALGHNHVHHDGKAPTCTEKGWAAYDTCSRCDYSTYKEIAATGHHYTDTVTAPTCTAKGYTTHTCACGNSYVDNYTNALGHSYKNGVCTRCNAKSPSYVAAPVIKITTSSGKPKISWSAVDGATKYYIYRSTDGKTYKQYTTTTKTSYTNSNATIGTTYYYKVKAAKVVNGKTVYSAYSNIKSIKCTPAAPVVSISRSSGKPKLTWKAVTGASKYYIYRSTDGKTYKQYTTTTKTSYTNTGAASGKKYYYKVKAVAVVNKKNVFSAYSTAKNLMTTIATPTVSITTANGKPKVSWKAVTGADKYIVYRSTDGKSFKQLSTTTKTSLTNTGAKKNTKYYYKVKAVCTKNTSANSALSKAVSIKATK